jgi:hypothetical protein
MLRAREILNGLYLRIRKSLSRVQLRRFKPEELPMDTDMPMNPVRLLVLYQ